MMADTQIGNFELGIAHPDDTHDYRLGVRLNWGDGRATNWLDLGKTAFAAHPRCPLSKFHFPELTSARKALDIFARWYKVERMQIFSLVALPDNELPADLNGGQDRFGLTPGKIYEAPLEAFTPESGDCFVYILNDQKGQRNVCARRFRKDTLPPQFAHLVPFHAHIIA